VADKQPSSHQQKQLVAVYWLAKEARLSSGITVDHINTCYHGGRVEASEQSQERPGRDGDEEGLAGHERWEQR
jgi:hypothetical protein